MNRSKAWSYSLALSLFVGAASSLMGQVVPRTRPISEKAFSHPDLFVPERTQTLQEVGPTLAARLQPQLANFGVHSESAFYDARTGRWSSLILKQALIPGTGSGNKLSWPGGKAPQGDTLLGDQAWSSLRTYLTNHQKDLKIDINELEAAPRVAVYDHGNLIFINVARVVGGVPVRDNSIGAAINHGNLILLGLQKWGDVNAAPNPSVSAESAKDAVRNHIGSTAAIAFNKAAHLEFVPMAAGESLYYRLAWVVTGKVSGDIGTWEGLVDAGNGTLFSFEDRTQYAQNPKAATGGGAGTGVIAGGVYPISNDQFEPGGIEQPAWPMSFVDYTIDGVKQFTDVGGNIGCIPGSISTALAGKFLKMVDTCGAANETGSGGIDLGSGPTPTATDCTVPAGHSAGDTKSSRSGYYELNRQIEKAQSHLGPTDPAGIWLRGQLIANMNVNDVCNAGWDGSTVNFFRSAIPSGCRNTGEIAAIFDHEWGHGVDNNGVNPNIASPGEAIADMYAMLRLDVSCIGRGFFVSDMCSGYGDGCIGTPETGGCTGVRDIDYAQHRCDLPHTISWITGGFTNAQCDGTGAATACPVGSQNGPCGHEVHCEGMVMAETGWDLMKRDLTAAPFNYDLQRAHEIAARLLYLGAQPVGNWFTCSVGGGCSATGGYLSLLAVDDDNGDLTDGTPHMTAIRAAFERHEIHCATPAPVNSGCTGAPDEAPVVTLVGLDRSVQVSWTAVPNAAGYLVYRGDGIDGCNFGRPIIADTTDLTFLDSGLANGRDYSYSVVPYGGTAACSGPMSVCVTAAPIAGPNLGFVGTTPVTGGDGDPFLDNCELATVGFSVNNAGIIDLTNVRITSITAVDQPQTTIVTTLPAPIAASMATCTVVAGSFQVIAQGLTFDGEADFIVEVTADEFAGETRSQVIKLFHTESDLALVPTQTFSFEDGRDGWTTLSGTFNRILGAGANGTLAHMSSSTDTAFACDVVASPPLALTDTSTLTMWVRYDIEPHSDADYDRANISIVNGTTGDRTVVHPSSGRVYTVADGSANGTCATSGQAGWNGQTPGFPTGFFEADWTSAALNPGGALTGITGWLQVNYGTDELDSRKGFDFDEVTITNFYSLVPDGHSDDCSASTTVGPKALAVDTLGNGVLEAGETAVVAPTWTNTGLNAIALNGTITSFSGPDGPTYGTPDAAASYGSLEPSADASCGSDCYSVNITTAARPSTHWDAALTEQVGDTALAQYTNTKVWTLHVGGSFSDVPSDNGFYPSIENVFHNGVTAGCGDGTAFCPASTVTRQQMAVFLLKAKEGAAYTPPACTTATFTDVPCDSPFAPWVNELAARGVTAGCGDGTTYCPTDPTNRQQMAVFLLKTKEGSAYVPPACSTATFDDVPCSSPFSTWIYELVNRNVTAGCGGPNYCPTGQVARQQMAVFLVKTFGLVLYGP